MSRHFRRLHVAGLFLIFTLVLGGGALVSAQDGSPAITFFSGNLDQITPDAAESGTAAVTLSWQTANMRPTDPLGLQVFVMGAWHEVSLPLDELPLPANGRLAWIVPHTLSFDPPRFRLLLRDAAGAALSEAYYTIPYTADVGTPVITFDVPAEAPLLLSDLLNGVAVPAAWSVTNRPPDSNLVFEQLTAGGEAINVELPRYWTWVRSSGQGAVRPRWLADGTDEIRLRARLVSAASGQEYAASDVQTLSVSLDVPAPSATVPPPDTGEPEVLAFAVSNDHPSRGDTVTFTWQVANTSEIWLAYVHLDFGPLPGYPPSWLPVLPSLLEFEQTLGPFPAAGSFDLAIPPDYPQRGMQVHIGASPDHLRNYDRTARLDLTFADVLQPLVAHHFGFDVESAARGQDVVISWDVANTRDSTDTLFIDYVGLILGAAVSPVTPENGRLTGLPASGTVTLTIPDFPPEYTAMWVTLGRDLEPNTIYEGLPLPLD